MAVASTVPTDPHWIPPQVARDVADWQAGLRSPNTAASYRNDWREYWIWCQTEGLSVYEITPRFLGLWRIRLDRELKRAPATVNRKIAALRSWHRFLVEERNATPQIGIRPHPAAALSEARWTDTGMTQKLVSAAESGQFHAADRALLWLMMHGLRRAEAVSATFDDLNRRETFWTLRVVGKGGRRRVIRLADHAALVFERAAADLPTVRGDVDRWPLTDPRLREIPIAHLPADVTGGTLPIDYPNRFLKRLSDTAHIEPHVTPHMLRHGFACALHRHGADPYQIQTALGHANLATTQHYLHSLENWEQSPIETITGGWLADALADPA